ncbi:MAG: hypothetical protein M1825_005186 [Sarcosagium campestre]|nr:MAG: hypothetical protein M1825_005186 [Sarcosagium campestre]
MTPSRSVIANIARRRPPSGITRPIRSYINFRRGLHGGMGPPKPERSYAEAVAALNTLQSNHATLEAIRRSGRSMNTEAIPEMIEWCRKAGYDTHLLLLCGAKFGSVGQQSDFDRLNPIHIAGTKGKGSTSAFIASILSQYRKPEDATISSVSSSSAAASTPALTATGSKSKTRLDKIGLYTSPHLRSVRERIQINGEPLSESQFARYFFATWDRLEAAAQNAGLPADRPANKPAYFRFLTLMALHAYMEEGVDTAVIEAGIGGEYDSTNILVRPSVTGITNLGIDHVAILGSTIDEIAWHKGGIIKVGVPIYTVSLQPESALKVLRDRAAAKGAPLFIVGRHPALEEGGGVELGLAADFQKTNASLAIAIAAAHLRSLGQGDVPSNAESTLPQEFVRGLAQVRWPGRCETRQDTLAPLTWHIDGGHTLDSITLAAKWFASSLSGASDGAAPRILIFNQQTRDASALARALHVTVADAIRHQRPFTHVGLCTNITFRDGGCKPDLVSVGTSSADVADLTVQNELARLWSEMESGAAGSGSEPTRVVVMRTIEETVEWARGVAAESKDGAVGFVTGSLHLVGGFLEVLEREETETPPS